MGIIELVFYGVILKFKKFVMLVFIGVGIVGLFVGIIYVILYVL